MAVSKEVDPATLMPLEPDDPLVALLAAQLEMDEEKEPEEAAPEDADTEETKQPRPSIGHKIQVLDQLKLQTPTGRQTAPTSALRILSVSHAQCCGKLTATKI